MNLSHESYFTLTFVLMTLCITSCQGQGNTCDINSRPHPQGICGPRLSRAHSNLCFLLSQAYPKHFPGKRSVDSRNYVDKIYEIPLSVLAELDIINDNWGAFLNKREYPYAFLSTGTLQSDEPETSLGEGQPDMSDIKGMTRSLLQLLRKKSDRFKRVVSQSSMVCDCCYNICTPRHLATYC